MEIRFENIAQVKIRHDYYKPQGLNWKTETPQNYNVQDWIDIIPTAQTQKQLLDLGLRFRTNQTGFSLFAEVVPSGNHFVLKKNFIQNSSLQFLVVAKGSFFQFITRISEGAGIAVFSNRKGHKTAGTDNTYYLHRDVPNTNPGTVSVGTLRRNANTLYQARQLTNSQPPGPAWQSLGTHTHFTTMADKMDINHGLVTIYSPANASFNIVDICGNTVWHKVFAADYPHQSYKIEELIDAAEGMYALKRDGVVIREFYQAKNTYPQTIAAIELVLQGDVATIQPGQQLAQEWMPIANGTGSFARGRINPREFVIHFLAPFAQWQYVLSRDLEIAPAAINSAGYQQSAPLTITSQQPLVINKYAQGTDFGLEQDFPAATPSIIKAEKNNQGNITRLYTEIFVNV